ncbi:unnamed protein product [Vitrella brassicaformis CCMP3155]|uniref:EamA domain-containing protein n=2 Tax=Vitrella brassicaformis TaxID=1169539 RepID=A0A0G4FHU1_VITBC|nr:unnamed protein product [Vitrella brassicaformis CCMP3155]|eukprot:CEM12881.1 unnamed protein product [Vitrella brassicaformis CCMP3155]
MVSGAAVHPTVYGASAASTKDASLGSEENVGHSAAGHHDVPSHRLIAFTHEAAYSKLTTELSSLNHLSDDDPLPEGKREEGGLCRRAAGLVLCGVSAVLFSLSSTLVKVTAAKTSVFYVLLARGLTELVCGSACLAVQMVVERRWISPFGLPEIRHLLVARALCGSCAIGLFFFCISQLPLGDASAAFFTTPIFTAVLASCVLGEPWTAVCTLAALCSLAGVVFIAQPDVLFHHDGIHPHDSIVPSATPVVTSRVVAVLLALTGALAGATAYTLVRRIGTRVPALVLVLYLSVSTTLTSIVLVATLRPSPRHSSNTDLSLLGWLAAVGVLGFAAHWCLNRGLQIEKAGPGAFVSNLDVALAYILQVCVLGRPLDGWSVCGAALIVAAACLMVLQKMNNAHEPEGAARARCSASTGGS